MRVSSPSFLLNAPPVITVKPRKLASLFENDAQRSRTTRREIELLIGRWKEGRAKGGIGMRRRFARYRKPVHWPVCPAAILAIVRHRKVAGRSRVESRAVRAKSRGKMRDLINRTLALGFAPTSPQNLPLPRFYRPAITFLFRRWFLRLRSIVNNAPLLCRTEHSVSPARNFPATSNSSATPLPLPHQFPLFLQSSNIH